MNVIFRFGLPNWGVMLLTAGMIFLGFKIVAIRCFTAKLLRPASWQEKFLFAATWPRMNLRDFLTPRLAAAAPRWPDLIFALCNIGLGAVVLTSVAPMYLATNELLAGWLAMVGLGLLFHFGLLQLLPCLWHVGGKEWRPLMNLPIAATSLADFWGRRWNLAFRDFAHEHVFKPVAERWGTEFAAFAGFVFSGLIHELAISIPAGAGFGLPMLYFLAQWLGLCFERSRIGRWLGLRGGFRGWLFTLLFVVGSAYWLFHPLFVHNVIVPLLRAIH